MVFDITRPASFENLPTWINELWDNSGRGKVPIVLLGNKADLKDKVPEHIRDTQISEYISELNAKLGSAGFFVEFLETSALTGQNIEQAFNTIGKQVVSWIKSNK